jgi:hypothetical protein
MIVDRRRRCGEENYFLSANRIIEAHGHLAVGESLDRRDGEPAAKIALNGRCERATGRTSEERRRRGRVRRGP